MLGGERVVAAVWKTRGREAASAKESEDGFLTTGDVAVSTRMICESAPSMGLPSCAEENRQRRTAVGAMPTYSRKVHPKHLLPYSELHS